MSKITLPLNRGSDLDLTAVLDENGVLLNMTGWTVTWMSVQPSILLPDLSIQISRPAFGETKIMLPFSSKWPQGVDSKVSIRWKYSGLPDAMPQLLVVME